MGKIRPRRAGWSVLGAVALAATGLCGLVTDVPQVTAMAAPRTNAACSILAKVIDIVTEPVAAAAGQSPSWVPLQANGWTVFAPNDQWTLTASDAGADVNSPGGQQDASLLTWYSLGVPWTLKSLGAKFLGHLSHIEDLCQTAVARSASGQSQATELTGYLGHQKLTAVLIDLLPTPTTETYVGESRYIYTPASQWSTANAKTLALIIRRAIQVPQSLG